MGNEPAVPGVRYDIGGYSLHIKCAGTGRPAAILDSGLAGNSLLWVNAIPEIAKLTQVCAIDRPGYAWSDPAPPDIARTSDRIVNEFRLALNAAGVLPPYILVGHSFGAINMLVFAYKHPDQVAGLVLVDPSHPEMFDRVPQIPGPKTVTRSFQLIDLLGRVGLLRIFGPLLVRQLLPGGSKTLPVDDWRALIYYGSQAITYQTAMREAQSGRVNFAMARGGPGSLNDIPLEILSADWWTTGKNTAMKRLSMDLREEMVVLSSCGRHTVVENCEHTDLPVVRPDAVAASVGRIATLFAEREIN